MNVDEAFEKFHTMATACGVELSDLHDAVTGSRECILICNEIPCLRLVWQPNDKSLSLEVSHGPVIGPEIFWMDLIRGELVHSELIFDTNDFTFHEALKYGLDLCEKPHNHPPTFARDAPSVHWHFPVHAFSRDS